MSDRTSLDRQMADQGGWLFSTTPRMERDRRSIRHYHRLGRFGRLIPLQRVSCALVAGLNPHRLPISYSAAARILGRDHRQVRHAVERAIQLMGVP